MNYIKIIVLISVALNCFAQKTYKNSGTPKNESLNFVLEEKAICDFNSCEDSFVTYNSIFIPNKVDKDSSFFFLDSDNSKVVKFDKKGQFITSFSNNGNGPGEFPNNFVLRFYVTSDSLYLVNHCERKILIFDTDGKFSCNRTYPIESNPSGNMIVINNKLLYDTFGGMYEKCWHKLVLADLNMKIVKEIYSQDTEETPAEIMSGKFAFEIASSKDEIFMSVPGDYGRYLINVYDYSGNLKYKISKHYRKLESDNEKLKKTMKKYGISSRGLADYERPIEKMFCDSKGKLFVHSLRDDDKGRCYYFDIFQKGEFLNRIAFEVPDNIDRICFRNDFAYGYDCDNNAITVYEYKEVRK